MSAVKDAFDKDYQNFLENHAQLPAEISSEYEMCSCLWESAGKETYLIRAKSSKKPYILKVADISCRENLSAEYRLLGSISHDSLPLPVFYCRQNNRDFFIREYIEGKTLLQLVDEKGALSIDETIRISLALCDTLQYLHSLNPPVIHRDIKPQNVIITPGKSVRLIDFGIARRYQQDAAKDTIFMGTEATAAPEQYGYMQTDVRSDIYSLGVLMLFLCTETYDVQIGPKGIGNRQFIKILSKCTNFDPAGRYSSVTQLRSALQKVRPAPKRRPIASLLPAFLLGAFVGFFLNSVIFVPHEPIAADLPLSPSPIVAVSESPVPPQSTAETTAVSFNSPLIEQAVRKELGKSLGDVILPAELSRVTKLLISGNTVYDDWNNHFSIGKDQYVNDRRDETIGAIQDLSDIAKLNNLTELALFSQNISDISALRGMHLSKLGLGGNVIRDISVLANMDSLQTLNLSNNPVSDLSPLSTIASLIDLDASRISAVDFSPIGGLRLERLSLIDSNVPDYSFLRRIPSLRMLRTKYLESASLQIIASLKTLREFTAYNSDISDLKFLQQLPDLELLDITGCKVTSLAGIEVCPRLSLLFFGSNPVESLAPLGKLKTLSGIDLFDIATQDYSPLGDIPSLKRVGCFADQAAALKPLADQYGFTLSIMN